MRYLVGVLSGIFLFGMAVMLTPAHAQTPYDECVEGPLSGAVDGDQERLRREGLCLIDKGGNYIDGGVRRFERANELDSTEPPQPVPDHPVATHPIDPIPSNFDRDDYLGSKRIPPSAAPDVVGAFRLICQVAKHGTFDPIVYPGKAKAGHLHTFFGNTGISPDSTYESLRTTGDSTCVNKLNRSIYWVPAMIYGGDQVLVPGAFGLYYKRRPASDPFCMEAANGCVAQPDGIKVIFGYDMLGGPTTAGFDWLCKGSNGYSTHPDLEDLTAKCVNPKEVSARVNSMPCWNGKDLDSPNHRSHVSRFIRDASTNWKTKCTPGYPKIIPTFTVSAVYDVEGLDVSKLELSCDKMAGTKRGGCLHTDLWDAWDGPTKQAWTENCIDKLLNCSDGDLGNGQIMKRWEGFGYKADPRLVPVP